MWAEPGGVGCCNRVSREVRGYMGVGAGVAGTAKIGRLIKTEMPETKTD